MNDCVNTRHSLYIKPFLWRWRVFWRKSAATGRPPDAAAAKTKGWCQRLSWFLNVKSRVNDFFFKRLPLIEGSVFFSFSRWIASNQLFCFQSRFAKTASSSKTFFTYHGNLRKCCSDKGAAFVSQWLNTCLVIQRLWVLMLGFYSVGLFSDLGPLDRTIEKVSNPSLAIINESMLYS